MQNGFRTIIVLGCLLAAGFNASAQQQGANYDVFVPISKYISQGNTDALSAWFADNLDIVVLSKGGNSSRNQAKLLVDAFFSNHTPRSFEVTYTAGRGGMKYALGNLNAGGENFLVTIFVNCNTESTGGSSRIQQFKIERMQ